jgi:O-antigen/teichoic acid export membrane protein
LYFYTSTGRSRRQCWVDEVTVEANLSDLSTAERLTPTLPGPVEDYQPRRPWARWSARIQALGLQSILANASSLVGTTVVSSGLGAAYWWVAAHYFQTSDVGIASAAIAATVLLAAASTFGTGTLLIGELAGRSVIERSRLICTALAVSMIAAAVLGTIFGILAPYLSPELALLGSGLGAIVLCALTASFSAAGLVIDLALIGVLRGDLQFTRNVVMAVVKLVLLIVVAMLPFTDRALAIYLSWFGGTVLSFVAVIRIASLGHLPVLAYRPQLSLLHRLGRSALEHHALNLSLQVPTLLMPMVVAVTLSATSTAYYYVASMIAGLVYVVPIALTTALYAAASHDPSTFARKLRTTLWLSTGASVAANLGLIVLAEPLLTLFGRAYATEVASVLHLLVLGVFPGLVKMHFVTVCQANRHVRRAAIVCAIGSAAELVGAALGARVGGLDGLVLGYLAVITVEACCVAPVIIRALTPGLNPRSLRSWVGATHCGTRDRHGKRPDQSWSGRLRVLRRVTDSAGQGR